MYLIYWQLIKEYEGIEENSKWTEIERQTADIGTNTDTSPGWKRTWWKMIGKEEN